MTHPKKSPQARLDALYQAKSESIYKPTVEEQQSGEWPTMSHLVALDLLTQLDAANARAEAAEAHRATPVEALKITQHLACCLANFHGESCDCGKDQALSNTSHAHSAAVERIRAEERSRVCGWRKDRSDEYWESQCKLAWVFTEGDAPAENEMTYCPKCAGRIAILNRADGEAG